ncbi:MAG TPA: SEC-C metal-binding domain-containing protein [Xanthobacteraceae bacterium]
MVAKARSPAGIVEPEYYPSAFFLWSRSGGVPCESNPNTSTPIAFEVSSKRRKGFPSECQVKRGVRVLGGRKELVEKLGRNDPCPCGSGRRFQTLLHAERRV